MLGKLQRGCEEVSRTRGTGNELTNYARWTVYFVERGNTKNGNNELKLRELKDTRIPRQTNFFSKSVPLDN